MIGLILASLMALASAQLSSSQTVPGSLVVLQMQRESSEKELQGLLKLSSETLPFRVFKDETLGENVYQGVIAVPYEAKLGQARVEVHERDSLVFEHPLKIQEGDYPSETLRVDGRRVNPRSKKDLLRIQHERTEIANAYAHDLGQKLWDGPFHWPLKKIITSPFGGRRVYNGVLKSYHTGVDLRAKMNTPVHAAAKGQVVLAKDLFFTGNTVILSHGFGVFTLYAHLNRILVKKGDSVKLGQVLAKSGKTGRVNGPHLHWQAVVHHVKVNPSGLVHAMR